MAPAYQLIDNFTTGPYVVTLTAGDDDHDAAASVPGGSRHTWLNIGSNPNGLAATLSVGSGDFMAHAESGVNQGSYLIYGFNANLNLNLGNENAFRFLVGPSDLFNLTVQVYNHTSGWWTSNGRSISASSPTYVTVPFSDFGSMDFAHVDQMLFGMRTNGPVSSCHMTSIEAVPEPTTFLVVGWPMVLLLRRRTG